MPEELFAIRPFAAGGKGDFSRADIRMATKAIRRFGLSDELRERMKQLSAKIMEESTEEKTQLLAIKMLTEMDKIDSKREENVIQEKHYEVIEATAVMRAAMGSSKVRDQLAKLSDQICEEKPIVLNGKHELP